MTGKIIKGIAGFYYIHAGHDKVYACKAKGVFRNRGNQAGRGRQRGIYGAGRDSPGGKYR